MNNLIKTCNKCHQEKQLIEFYPDSKAKDGHRGDCKVCNCESRKKWQKENLDKVLEKNRKWIKNNSDHVKEYKKSYAPRRRELAKHKYNTDEEYRTQRIEEVRAYRNNPNNKNKIKEIRQKLTTKYKTNPLWRLKNNLRRRLSFVLNGKRKANSTEKLVGCNWFQLREHLEKQFKDGMTWDNYGKKGWHVDHIIPCDVFDLSIPEEQSKCFHYTNLQPLWWFDNLEKGSKIL